MFRNMEKEELQNRKLEQKEGLCSYYENVKSMQNVVVKLEDFVQAIRSVRWKQRVEEFRQKEAAGDKGGANAIKTRMPGLIVAGVCEGGHSKVSFRTFSGYLMIDIDDYKGDVRQLLERLMQLPWVKAGWVSISGEGIKVIVRIETFTQYEYEQLAYPIVARYISRLLELPVDMRCKDLSRTCYASYDPQAFCKETCETFPWRDEVEAFLAEQEATGETQGVKPAKQAVVSTAEGLVAKFLENFIERHPYVRHHRHDFQLALGREARRAGMNETEFEELVKLAVIRLAMPDCDGPEIKRNLSDAYRFAEVNNLASIPPKGSQGSQGSREPFVRAEELEEASARSYEMRLSASFIPDWIYEGLPAILAEGLKVAKDPRQRDMLFLAMMTNLSACMPGVKMVYDDTFIYPHLFLNVIASSASGKGIMAHAVQLARPIHDLLKEENARKMRQYEEDLLLWEQERARALKEKRKPDLQLRPEQPKRKTLMVPADVSRTNLIQLMSGSPDGVLLNVSEMDTLRNALGTEYGRFDDLMRACFHHEMFGSDFKVDKQSYMVYCPKMAFCASGTPSQFYKLCPSAENGAYSRYLIYMAEQETEFRLMSPNGEQLNRNEVFHRLGGKVLEMYHFLKENHTEVKLSKEQWEWHRSYFDGMLKQVKLEEVEAPVSIVLRHGLNMARLAMIFTALRKFDEQWCFHEMTCTDEDFRMAMAVTEVLLEHSLMYSTTLRKEVGAPTPMRHYFRVLEALEKLPAKFRYNELMEVLLSSGISLSTAKRDRVRLIEMGIVVKEGDSYRFANRKWRSNLKNHARDLGSR